MTAVALRAFGTVLLLATSPMSQRVERADDALQQLANLTDAIRRDANDLNRISGQHTGNCDRFVLFTDVQPDATSAIHMLDGFRTVLLMYDAVSSPRDRTALKGIVSAAADHTAKILDLNVEGVVAALGQPDMPAGAAVVANRLKDNIRTASELIARVELK